MRILDHSNPLSAQLYKLTYYINRVKSSWTLSICCWKKIKPKNFSPNTFESILCVSILSKVPQNALYMCIFPRTVARTQKNASKQCCGSGWNRIHLGPWIRININIFFLPWNHIFLIALFLMRAIRFRLENLKFFLPLKDVLKSIL